MEPFRDLSRTLHPPREPCSTTGECCHWASAHNGRLREVRNSQPVNRCHPLIQPPFSLLVGPSVHPTGHSADGVLLLAGYLEYCCHLLPYGRQAGGRWREGGHG